MGLRKGCFNRKRKREQQEDKEEGIWCDQAGPSRALGFRVTLAVGWRQSWNASWGVGEPTLFHLDMFIYSKN
jgi:hypothetical protein